MNRFAGTSKCIACGKDVETHAGHLIAKERMALGNLIDVKIMAGWCSMECHDNCGLSHDENGCYGKYDNKYGYIENVFRR